MSTQETTLPPPPLELEPPLITISLQYYLELTRNKYHTIWDQYAVIPKELASIIQAADPQEELHHILDYGNDKLVKLYPIKIWRECQEKREQDKERQSKESQERFYKEETLEIFKKQIQRKRDIIHEVTADLRKRLPKWVETMGAGTQGWKKPIENLEYFVYRGLMGELNPKLQEMMALDVEIVKEFKSLPFDENWQNSYFQDNVVSLYKI